MIDYSLSLEDKMPLWIRSKYSKMTTRLVSYRQKISGLSSRQKVWTVTLTVLVVCAVILLVANTRGENKTPTEERSKRDQEQSSLTKSSGAVFTRWGRSVCPPQAYLIYEGVTGGSDRLNKGGGSNYVCLPLDPMYESKQSHAHHAKMYGAEYEDLDALLHKQLHDHNVPCAVCQSTLRTNMMMIPARNECYSDWHAEYSGYLVAAYHGHVGKTAYVCLDADPDMDQAGYRNENGALMYRVQGICGSLPCPPYEEGKPLTCVVCTK